MQGPDFIEQIPSVSTFMSDNSVKYVNFLCNEEEPGYHVMKRISCNEEEPGYHVQHQSKPAEPRRFFVYIQCDFV